MGGRDIEALIALIEARRDWGHAWDRGRDCVSFALACVEAQTGIDLLAEIPSWASRSQALRVTRQMGGLQAALDARLPRIEPVFAQRGDVAGIADPVFGVRLMVVEGAMLVGPGETGLERQARRAMIAAWSAEPRGGPRT